jgi:zinc dependent phospholipase C
MRIKSIAVLLCFGMMAVVPLSGYSVLSHEELIDMAWQSDIRPALLKRFPNTSAEDLKKAHAFAYGGSVIQDIGYYPFGSHEFTNLLHYVRTGDFVAWMIRDARDVNEFAFALGALSHYAADSWGHPAVNAGVAIEYPKLRNRYGDAVTYEEDPEAHLKTEFSFDVVQVAKHRYFSQQYHDFIGFEVSQSLMERAFEDTYGIPTKDLLRDEDVSIASYRFAIGQVIPEMTQVALASRKTHVGEKNDPARQEFLYHLSRADYEKDFGAKYRKPGFFARVIAFLLKLIPKFGPFKALAYKDPTPQTEDRYFKSMDNVVSEYHKLVQQVDAKDLQIPNRNLDTGDPTIAAKYKLADEAYDDLVRRLAKDNFANVTPALKENILNYFASGPALDSVKGKQRKETESALRALKAAPVKPLTRNAPAL